MKQVIKTTITVLVATVCCLISLMTIFIYYQEIDFLNYSVAYEYMPIILDVETEYIGKEYAGDVQDGYSYYRVYITLENKSNYGKKGSEIQIKYDTDTYTGNGEQIYNIFRASNDYFGKYDDTAYFPAGSVSTYCEVVCIEEGCKGFEIYLFNYQSEENHGIMVDL